jgi:hypothetical protein
MVEKAKIFYFSVFILVVFAFIFHVTAMGHSHWKKATASNNNGSILISGNQTTIGLFTRCITTNITNQETCFPNVFPSNNSCNYTANCSQAGSSCSCDYLPSSKGIAACAIIASIFLGLAIIILFIHSINTAETRTIGLVLGLFPLLLLLLAFIFILITLILIGSYLSRDMMQIVQLYLNNAPTADVTTFRGQTQQLFQIKVDWGTGLDIIALFFTFLSLVLYSAFVFKFGRS